MGGRRIIGDIGGTNARFAIAEGGKYRELMHVEVAWFGSLHDALTDYLNVLPPALRSGLDGGLAVAGPVFGDKVALTNLGWSFSISDLHRSLGHIIVLGEVHLRQILQSYAITTTASERIDPLTRMRRSLARYSAPVSSVHAPSWADSITTMVGFRFSVHTPFSRAGSSFMPWNRSLQSLPSSIPLRRRRP